MIKSMTGYGRAQQTLCGRDITVEIRSVNHRYFEYASRLPRSFGYLDEKLKALLQSAIFRGKVDCFVTIVSVDSGGAQVAVCHELAEAYVRALRALGEELSLPDDLTLSSISRFSDIFVVQHAPEDEDEVWECVRTVAEEALAQFVSMRAAEGTRLRDDILSRLKVIEDCVSAVEVQSPRTVAAYRERLFVKLQEILESKTIDTQRVLTEAAIVADRLAVDEETVRLRSHIAQLRDFLQSPDPIGRKMDFLVQELNREANTIGSKCQDVEIAQTVITIKSEIEKIREQIQNIE